MTSANGSSEPPMSSYQSRASIIAVLLLLAAGIFTLRSFLPALAWAAIFAIGLWPVRDRLARRWPDRQRDAIPLLLITCVLLLFVVPLILVAVPLIRDAHAASMWLEGVRQHGIAPPPLLSHLPSGSKLTSWWQANVGSAESISALTTKAAHGGLTHVAGLVAAQAIHRTILIGFMLLTLFFLLRDGDNVAREVRTGSRRAFGAAGEHVGAQIVRSVRGTVNGLVLVGLAEGIIMGIVYAVTGVPHPTLFGLMTALLAMVPFGAPLAFIVAAGILLMHNAIWSAIIVVVVGMIVSFTADHFFRPVLIGGATKLPFLWVLLGILGGVETWGLVGLFVGPAIMAALSLLWDEWAGRRKGPLNSQRSNNA